MEKWQQLVSVCVGGIIALAAAWGGQRYARTNAKRELLRSKLEELYRLSLSLDTWNTNSCAHLVQAMLKSSPPLVKGDISNCPIDEIAMNTRLYFHGLNSELARLVDLERALQRGFYDFAMNEVKERPVRPVKAYDEMLSDREQEVRAVNVEFRKRLEREMKGVLG